MESETVLIGTFDYHEARRLKSLFEEKGITLHIASNPDNCASGQCKPGFEVFAPPEHLPAIREFFMSERSRQLGLENPVFQDEGFNPENASAVCPACGEKFSTSLHECPGCGLMFAVPE